METISTTKNEWIVLLDLRVGKKSYKSGHSAPISVQKREILSIDFMKLNSGRLMQKVWITTSCQICRESHRALEWHYQNLLWRAFF